MYPWKYWWTQLLTYLAVYVLVDMVLRVTTDLSDWRHFVFVVPIAASLTLVLDYLIVRRKRKQDRQAS